MVVLEADIKQSRQPVKSAHSAVYAVDRRIFAFLAKCGNLFKSLLEMEGKCAIMNYSEAGSALGTSLTSPTTTISGRYPSPFRERLSKAGARCLVEYCAGMRRGLAVWGRMQAEGYEETGGWRGGGIEVVRSC